MTRWVRAAALTRRLTGGVLALVATLGCGPILGVDGYTTAPPPGDDASTGIGQARLSLPATPDPGFAAKCLDCVERECATERAACKASSRCMALLAEHSRCTDPNCIFRARDTHDPSPAFDDYMACAFGDSRVPGSRPTACRDECNVGRNLACTRAYAWDKASAGRASVQVRVGTGALPSQELPLSYYAGDKASVCPSVPGLVCSPPTPLNAFGVAYVPAASPQAELSGGIVLLISGAREHVRVYHRPTIRSGSLDVNLAPRLVHDFLLGGDPWVPPNTYDPSASIVELFAFDCLGVLAPGTRFNLQTPASAGGGGAAGPQAVPFYYSDNLAVEDPASTSGQGGGGFYNVPAAFPIQVSVFSRVDDVLRWRATVQTEADWTTQVDLYPLPKP